jgi:hypothetical protein
MDNNNRSISVPLLDDNNFRNLATRMSATLVSKGLKAAIEAGELLL